MATDLQSPPQPSVTSLVGGILNDVQDLLKQQVELIGKEIKDDINKSMGAAIWLAAGAGVAAMGALLLCITIALALDYFIPEFHWWGGFAIVGGILTIVGLVTLYAAIKKFETLKAMPESVQAIKETVEWQTTPTPR
jgi:Putative Actinobacterial Holin-X, holin superfamily III